MRDGRPNLVAAPDGPDMRPWLAASAASIISFSCFTSVPCSVPVRFGFARNSRLSQAFIHSERFTLAEDNRTLDHILQFTDIARPAV